MKILTATLISAATLALAGCFGSDSSSRSESLAEREARGTALLARADNLDDTPIASVPTTGTARYSGMAAFSDGARFDMADVVSVGDLSMQAAFAQQRITGTVDRLQDIETGRRLPGSISMTGSVAGNEMMGTLGGRVDGGAITGSFSGDFLGSNADMVQGKMSGAVDGQTMSGIFVGEKR